MVLEGCGAAGGSDGGGSGRIGTVCNLCQRGGGRGEGIRTCQVSGRVLMLISRRMKARTLAAVQRAGMIVFVVRSRRVETSDANILCGGYTCKQPRNLVSR
jgi:hypothetical protein